MKKTLIILISSCLFLSGCVEKRYIERLGIITAIGYDLLEDDFMQGTMVFFQFDPNAENVSQIISSTAKTSKGIRQDGDLKSSKELASGQIRVVLFGEKAAEQGVSRILDTLKRDAAISDLLYLTVAQGEARDILQSNKMEDAADIGNYLKGLIRKNVRDESLPPSTLHDFLHKYYDRGVDPVLPVFSLTDNKPVLYYLALFQGDRFVSFMPVKQGFSLKILGSRFQAGHLEAELPREPFLPFIRTHEKENFMRDHVFVTMDEIRSDSEIKLMNPEELKYEVEISLETRIMEISEDIKLQEPKALKTMEDQLSDSIKQNVYSFIEVMKENKVDPIGFGQYYEASKRGMKLTEEEWREMIPEIDVEVTVNTKVLRHGIIQ